MESEHGISPKQLWILGMALYHGETTSLASVSAQQFIHTHVCVLILIIYRRQPLFLALTGTHPYQQTRVMQNRSMSLTFPTLCLWLIMLDCKMQLAPWSGQVISDLPSTEKLLTSLISVCEVDAFNVVY